MTDIIELKTARLKLRQWCENDLPAFAEMNADPKVMAFYPNTLSALESDALAERLSTLLTEQSWGMWAVEKSEDNSFIGFVGLHKPSYELPVSPCVEIGWRLARGEWGKGYATEAAKAAQTFAFSELKLLTLYSFTSVINRRSQSVMKHLHMRDTEQNFDHPMLPAQSPLREHVLYKIDCDSWRQLK